VLIFNGIAVAGDLRGGVGADLAEGEPGAAGPAEPPVDNADDGVQVRAGHRPDQDGTAGG